MEMTKIALGLAHVRKSLFVSVVAPMTFVALSSITRSAECMNDSLSLLPNRCSAECNEHACFPMRNGSYSEPQRHCLEQLSFLAAIDGAKQPQDYGVNADLGVRLRSQYAAALNEEIGLGFQIGSAVTWTDNAVRVFELIGEDTNRFQNYTTVGLFQRAGRWGWGGVFDHLYQNGFDDSSLGQYRGRISYELTKNTQIGLTGRLRAFDDKAEFLDTEVTLRSINQGSIYIRHFFETGVQSTWWLGLVDEHGESNAVLGPAPARNNAFVVGADFVAPLNDSFALYGEMNLITPADTGTVDAFFGIAYYPFANARVAHRSRWTPMLPTAASTSFSVDLLP